MADEREDVVVENPVQNNYLEAIQNLKKNTVPREDFEKVVEENKKLLDSLIEGNPAGEPQQEEPVNVQELRNKLFVENNEMTNLEFVENSLKLRKAVLDETGEDIFVGRGTKLVPTEEDHKIAEKVATVLQEMVDASNGDPGVFLVEYQRRVNDIPLPRRK